MRHSVDTAMLWGAFGVSLFGIFLTPVFFYVVCRVAGQRRPAPEGAERFDHAAGEGASPLTELSHV